METLILLSSLGSGRKIGKGFIEGHNSVSNVQVHVFVCVLCKPHSNCLRVIVKQKVFYVLPAPFPSQMGWGGGGGGGGEGGG